MSLFNDESRIMMVCVRNGIFYSKKRVLSIGRYKGGITPEEDHEDLTTSWKIEGRSENVVKMKPFQVYKIILRPYHVLTTFTPRP